MITTVFVLSAQRHFLLDAIVISGNSVVAYYPNETVQLTGDFNSEQDSLESEQNSE